MRGFVSPRYLPLLADFRKIHEYAWGAAALAHLYRGLSVAVTPNATTQFLGSATLLMAWIYEYLPITQPQQKNQSTLLPRACRWNFGGATRGQRKKVMEWRKVFEQLQLSEASPKLPTCNHVPMFQLLCYTIPIMFSGQLEPLQGHESSNCSRILHCCR
jgi:hypothetical protein